MSRDAVNPLLDPAFLSRLGRLALRTRRRFRGEYSGERRSRKLGTGLEFAGHRGYVHGDDLRQLDWALLGRLDRPYVKTYEQETDLTVHLLIDCSRSMGFGEPSKFVAATRIAAALAYIALASLDRVGVAFVGGRGLRVHGPARGRGALFPLLSFLGEGRADGDGGLRDGLAVHAAAVRPGLTFLFSDFFDPGVRDLVRPHQGRRHELVLVQLLAREELDPPFDGDLTLVDAETGERVELTLEKREREHYLARLEAHYRDLVETGRGHGMQVMQLASDASLEDALWGQLLPAVSQKG